MGGALPLGAELILVAHLFMAAATIGFARFYGFTLTFPAFAWIDLTGPLRVAVSLGASIPSIAVAYTLLKDAGVPATGIWLVLVAKELAIGAMLGIVLGMPFWAIQGAGDAIDVYRGASAANLLDPVNAQETTISGTFLGLLAMALFLALDGLPQLMDLLLRSQVVWPMMSPSPPFELERLRALAGIAVQGLLLGFIVAAPLFTTLLLVDVTLIFAVRGARSFHVYELAQAARGLMLLLVLPVFVILFSNNFASQSRDFLKATRTGLESLLR